MALAWNISFALNVCWLFLEVEKPLDMMEGKKPQNSWEASGNKSFNILNNPYLKKFLELANSVVWMFYWLAVFV